VHCASGKVKRPSSLERRLVQLGAALSLSVSAFALDPAKTVSQYNCQNWRRHDGLPVDRINAITQTRDGYLWLATQKGVVRYDGSEFKVLNPSSQKQFQTENVTCLARDHRGGFWFGLAGGSLGFCDGAAMPPVPSHPWLERAINVLAITQAKDGAVWLASDKGAMRFLADNSDGSAVFDELGNCSALFEDSQSRVWLGTVQHGLSYWQEGKLVQFPDESLKKNIIFAVAEDPQRRLWLGTEMGPRCYGPDFASAQIPETHAEVRALLVDRQGVVWMGTTGGGLVRFQHGAFSSFTRAEGLADDTVILPGSE
jgi:ligand-binding sensor domain-containing protein